MNPFTLTTDHVTVKLNYAKLLDWTNRYDPIRVPLDPDEYLTVSRTYELPQPVFQPKVEYLGWHEFEFDIGWDYRFTGDDYDTRLFLEAFSIHGNRWETVGEFNPSWQTWRMFLSPYPNTEAGLEADAANKKSYVRYRARWEAYFRYRTPVKTDWIEFDSRTIEPLSANLILPMPKMWKEPLPEPEPEPIPVDDTDVIDPIMKIPFTEVEVDFSQIPQKFPNVGQLYNGFVDGLHSWSGDTENVPEDYLGLRDPENWTKEEELGWMLGEWQRGTIQGQYFAYQRTTTEWTMELIGQRLVSYAEQSASEGEAGDLQDAAYGVGKGMTWFGEFMTSHAGTEFITGMALSKFAGRVPGARQAVKNAPTIGKLIQSDGEQLEFDFENLPPTEDDIAQAQQHVYTIYQNYEQARQSSLASFIGFLFPDDIAVRLMQQMSIKDLLAPALPHQDSPVENQQVSFDI